VSWCANAGLVTWGLLKQEHFGSYDDKGQFRSDFSKWHWQ
jgi:hypothetical protein